MADAPMEAEAAETEPTPTASSDGDAAAPGHAAQTDNASDKGDAQPSDSNDSASQPKPQGMMPPPKRMPAPKFKAPAPLAPLAPKPAADDADAAGEPLLTPRIDEV